MAGKVMVHAAGERVLLRRATAQQQKSNHADHRHDYVGFSMHFLVVLKAITPICPDYFKTDEKITCVVQTIPMLHRGVRHR